MSIDLDRPSGAEQARWFGRRAAGGACAHAHAHAHAHKETVTAGGGSFQAVFQRCTDGGYVVSLPAVPHLMTRGASYQHARIKALALVHGYLRALDAEGRLASRPRAPRPFEALPRAA